MSVAVDRVPGVLLLYHRPTLKQFIDADNVSENIAAFGRHSRFPVWGVNTDLGFPRRLDRLAFDAVLVHYSVFARDARAGGHDYKLGGGFFEYLAGSAAYKIATFQDEHHWCRKRFAFLDQYEFDCVYTMLEPPYGDQVYGTHTGVSKVVTNLPGYVGPELTETERFTVPGAERQIDIGYRGRPMPAYMGRGAMEKAEIGERFAAAASDSGLVLDIATGEGDRLYGDSWPRFMADCRAMLGVESGVSCFDLEDEVLNEYLSLSPSGEPVSIGQLERGALGRWDGSIPYRTISPRHFEAAALRVCQILYEGHYSGVLEPMRHYIPLKKDFSNFDEVIERFRDLELRRELAENAYRDLIASGAYTYEKLIAGFDETLLEAGLQPPEAAPDRAAVTAMLKQGSRLRKAVRYMASGWEWLHRTHPRTWRALHLISRPFVVPARALGQAGGRS